MQLSRQPAQTGKILIVDSDEGLVDELRAALTEREYTHIRAVTDPRLAAEAYADYRPDIVLLDRDMPHMDGFAVMDALADLENGSYLPVLMMVPDDGAAQRIKALASPAKDIIAKPIDVDELCVRMGNLLEVRLLYRELALKEHTLESVLDYTGEAIAMFDADDRLEFANGQYHEMFRLEGPVQPGVNATELRSRIKGSSTSRTTSKQSRASSSQTLPRSSNTSWILPRPRNGCSTALAPPSWTARRSTSGASSSTATSRRTPRSRR